MNPIEIRNSIIAFVFLIICLVAFGLPARASDTETITFGQVDDNASDSIVLFKQYVHTGNAAGENDCVDTREYDWVALSIDISGTINVDVDRTLTDNGTIVLGASDDLTADTFYSEAVVAPYYCYDVDACTACTISATWYLIRTVDNN